MPGIVKKSIRVLDLGVYLRDLKDRGYTQGAFGWLKGTDYLEVRAWRRLRNAKRPKAQRRPTTTEWVTSIESTPGVT